MPEKKSSKAKSVPAKIPELKVKVVESRRKAREYRFVETFRIGRGSDCEIQLEKPGISRRHAEISFKKGRWWYKDLKSANGSFIKGRRVDEVPLGKSSEVELGLKDAKIVFSAESSVSQDKTIVAEQPSLTQVIKHYFSEETGKRMSDHTRLIRGAFKQVQKKQKLRFISIIGGVVLIAILIGIYSYFQHKEIQRQKYLAEEMFYSMKSLELEIIQLRKIVEQTGDSSAIRSINKNLDRQREMYQNYEQFLEELHFYDDSKWNETDRLILHIARIFGECELAMPDDFIEEVNRYIKKWKTTTRLQSSIQTAFDNNYNKIIKQIMLEHDLPPQFFYLALKESNFNKRTIGPRTRFGIAKGIWQFIPATAKRYGLQTGPLVGYRRYDPRDDRYNFGKATRAAARYLRDIYNTEAQASGLLVIASYNWGERHIRELVRQMPNNPRERNFWQLLKLYKKEMPKQTYDYVFYIVSAAVIGENPGLFGFNFKNPILVTEDKASG